MPRPTTHPSRLPSASSSFSSSSKSRIHSKPPAAFSQDFSDDDEDNLNLPDDDGYEDEDDSELMEEDSEEDEWQTERMNPEAGRSSYQRTRDEEDSEDEEDGMAAYESDQGEMIDEEDEDEEEAIGKQLASIPFGSLVKAQKQLSKSNAHASRKGKARARDAHDDEEEESSKRRVKGAKGKKNGMNRRDVEGRSNKHAPTEMSTKRPVSRARQIVETTTKKSRDPRFDSLSGSVNPELFNRSYGFLSGSFEKELATLRATAAKAKKNSQLSIEEKERIEDSLRRMENRDVERRRKEREQAALKGWKKEEQEKRKEGKGAFYLKEAEKKKLFLKAKFDELSQDKRKLSKAMDKKRRKTSQKAKKLIPRARSGQ